MSGLNIFVMKLSWIYQMNYLGKLASWFQIFQEILIVFDKQNYNKMDILCKEANFVNDSVAMSYNIASTDTKGCMIMI